MELTEVPMSDLFGGTTEPDDKATGDLRGDYPGPIVTPDSNGNAVLCEGRFARFVSKKGWECIERKGCTGVVGIIALTTDNCILLVEQFRPPFGKNCIEIPAGLVGDHPVDPKDLVIISGGAKAKWDAEMDAANRELEEETGYKAGEIERMFNGPTSTGLSSETITIFIATECTRIGDGGGVAEEGENIILHKVPFVGIDNWLHRQEEAGKIIDLKVRLALYVWAALKVTAMVDKEWHL